MIIKYLGSVLQAGDFENRVVGLAWSPNNLKLAVALADRSIYLFDETGTKKDKFQTKPVDSQNGKKSYLVRAIAFSPDSTKIAVGQTDNIVYVYKIGEEWGEKKVICNKFGQSSAVTCMIWLSEGPIVIGLADGKVRVATTKSHRARTLYTADAPTIALAANVRGTGFLSSHADGSIIRYRTKEDGAGTDAQTGRFLTHGVPAYALAWTHGHIMAGGCDKRLTVYDNDGRVVRVFDHGRDPSEREASVACCSPSGQSVAVGSWNRLRMYDWIPRRSAWEESNDRQLPNVYTVTSMCWRRDGSRLVIGGLCGAVEQFETILRRAVVRGGHEIVHVGPCRVIVRSSSNDGTRRPVVVESRTGSEIEDVRVFGRRDNHVVARTRKSLVICDTELGLMSEIPWETSTRGSTTTTTTGGEKFFFEYPRVCLIFSAGELTVVEYGKNEILGTVRTEAVNPHVVSVRINERRRGPDGPDNKRLAYLVDPRTVRIVDLANGGAEMSAMSHDSRLDWLELSETGHRLLSRDRRGRLWLSDDRGESRTLLAAEVSFASWVPGSDVAVAQSNGNLAVWYNIDAPEGATMTPVRGDAVEIVREEDPRNRRTAVMVQDPATGRLREHLLDEDLIEFGAALGEDDFGRVVLFLEELGADSNNGQRHTEAMWENVAADAISRRKLPVAARCYAALGDVARSAFLRETAEGAERRARETATDPLDDPDSWARLAILNGELRTAEAVYLERNELDKALDMYRRYGHWEDALSLAESRNCPGTEVLRDKHLAWLLDSGQLARAATMIERDNPRRAMKLLTESGRAGRAARLLLANDSLLEDAPIVAEVTKILREADLTELAGEILERTSDLQGAIECYAGAGVFAKALELARRIQPDRVVELEKRWGEHLSRLGHHDAAIYRFVQAGENELAFHCAINARQWSKALELARVLEEPGEPGIRSRFVELAEHYASVGETVLSQELFLKVNDVEKAVDVHARAGDWSRAREVALETMEPERAGEILTGYARGLMDSGDRRNAEALLVAVGEYDAAIAMYRKAGQRADMMRLVARHRPDLLKTTHAHLARELEAAGKPREAEEHYLAAEDWKSAVAAYRSADMWEDALRVAKKWSGERAAHQVALLWARTMAAPELGAGLLRRLGYLDECLGLACEAGLSDWAAEVAAYGTAEQQREVSYRRAMALEDEGRFNEAEREFARAGKSHEAVQMYVHARDWEAAERVAETLNRDAVSRVLVARAAEAASDDDYALAETLLLRAHKPDAIVDLYKNAGMWSDAMRVCREYLPGREADLRRELSQKSSGLDDTESLAEAGRWLSSGETRMALDVLLAGPRASRPLLLRAAEILMNHADAETVTRLGVDLARRLTSIEENALAAQVFLQADRPKEAVDALMAIGEWNRARRIVEELAPELDSYLREEYRSATTSKEPRGTDPSMEIIAGVDTADRARLEAMAAEGQWNRLFQAASARSEEILHEYVARRSAELIKSGSAEQALELYAQYGAPDVPQYVNLYFRLSHAILTTSLGGGADDDDDDDGGGSEKLYSRLARLRNFLVGLCADQDGGENGKIEKLLKIAHYAAVGRALRSVPSLLDIAVKTSVTLLRHTDVLPADRCYYQAGMDKRKVGSDSEAFVFLNHFLDLEECIEEGGTGDTENAGILDVDDLRVTDFPLSVPLPETLGVESAKRQEAREWVLAVSMDRGVEQGLPVDQRGVYVGSLVRSDDPSEPLEECVLTGAPIRGPIVKFDETGRLADRSDWNKLTNAARQAPDESPINDVLHFIREWCGTAPNYAFSTR